MLSKKIIDALILIFILSLACGVIYGAETEEISHTHSSNMENGINMNESNDTGEFMNPAFLVQDINHTIYQSLKST